MPPSSHVNSQCLVPDLSGHPHFSPTKSFIIYLECAERVAHGLVRRLRDVDADVDVGDGGGQARGSNQVNVVEVWYFSHLGAT